MKESKIVEWLLRLALSAGFLSAVADRFGLWPENVSVWGNWENFIAYTKTLLSFLPDSLVLLSGAVATFFEIAFSILLLTNFKTTLIAKCSGGLLLLFALSMMLSNSIKAPLDYSVFSAAAAAFSLSIIVVYNKQKYS